MNTSSTDESFCGFDDSESEGGTSFHSMDSLVTTVSNVPSVSLVSVTTAPTVTVSTSTSSVGTVSSPRITRSRGTVKDYPNVQARVLERKRKSSL